MAERGRQVSMDHIPEVERENADNAFPSQFEDVSFGCITKENIIRRQLIKVVRSRYHLDSLLFPFNAFRIAQHQSK